MNAFLRSIDELSRFAAKLAALGIVVMVGLMFVGVIFRYAVNSPLIWIDEFVRYILVFTVMLAIADVMRRGENIKVDLLVELLPLKAQHAVEVAGLVAALIFALAMTGLGIDMVRFSASLGLTTAGKIDIPSAWVESALPLGGMLLSLATFARLIRLLRGDPVPEPDEHISLRGDEVE
jgi:TRAP-type C4-dicarboxylate transport system permease small subunit